jgi:chemotaxis protein CheD
VSLYDARNNAVALNLGEYAVMKGRGQLKILGLGSCVGLCLWDRLRRCAAMAHVVLPDSQIDPDKAKVQPGYFADTALPMLLKGLRAQGVAISPALTARLVGGGAVLFQDPFKVGLRNATALRQLLAQHNIPILGEVLGGQSQKTITLDVQTGQLEVLLAGGEVQHL